MGECGEGGAEGQRREGVGPLLQHLSKGSNSCPREVTLVHPPFKSSFTVFLCKCVYACIVFYMYMCSRMTICVCVFQVENVVVEVPFPKSVLNVTLTPNQGKYSFDPVSKLMTWDVGKIDTAKLPSIKGNVCLCFLLFYICV